MKKIANIQKASTDEIYHVSPAKIADELIERMKRGMAPLLFSSSLIPVGPGLRTQVRSELD